MNDKTLQRSIRCFCGQPLCVQGRREGRTGDQPGSRETLLPAHCPLGSPAAAWGVAWLQASLINKGHPHYSNAVQWQGCLWVTCALPRHCGVWSRQLEVGAAFLRGQNADRWAKSFAALPSQCGHGELSAYSPSALDLFGWCQENHRKGLRVEAWGNPQKEDVLLLITAVIMTANFYCLYDSLINVCLPLWTVSPWAQRQWMLSHALCP